MFSGVTATACDRPGYRCHVNNCEQADGEIYRRVSLCVRLYGSMCYVMLQ